MDCQFSVSGTSQNESPNPEALRLQTQKKANVAVQVQKLSAVEFIIAWGNPSFFI